MAKHKSPFDVVDLFAGPGGLGEGFASFSHGNSSPFHIRLSVEKDLLAHQTLELRAFYRQLNGQGVEDYRKHLQRKITRGELFDLHPSAAKVARAEAHGMELSAATRPELRAIFGSLRLSPDSTIIVGGPPCQAYSVAGRSRNSAKPGWSLERDHRSTLYQEYLHAIADLEPVAFVMENVRGLTSARMNGDSVLRRILEDLQDPAHATGRKGPRKKYRLVPLVPRSRRSGVSVDDVLPEDFLVHAEKYGVPQMRTRLIIIGVREDASVAMEPIFAAEESANTVRSAISRLPRVRSGISGAADSFEAWLAVVRSVLYTSWYRGLDAEVKREIRTAVATASESPLTRGEEFLDSRASSSVLRAHLNHTARGHMETDIHRYIFAASWAAVNGTSPTLRDFPEDLWPAHANVSQALQGGNFSDRFRVQCWDAPATTVVSHISKDGHYYIHPDPSQCRSLTVREAADLQTFPRDYFFCGPRTSQYHQVGNAVPVQLSRRIAGALYRYLGSP